MGFKSMLNDAEITVLGDPRFDMKWKKELKHLLEGHFGAGVKKNMLNVIYIGSNLQGFGMGGRGLEEVSDIAQVFSQLGNVNLLIKPHPRSRSNRDIKGIMDEHNFKNYTILSDEPLLAYACSADLVISSLSSAVNDILPEYPEKLVIYDKFSSDLGLENIYKKDFSYFHAKEELYDFLKKRTYNGDRNKVIKFCEKWVGGGDSLDGIVDRYCNNITRLLRKGKV